MNGQEQSHTKIDLMRIRAGSTVVIETESSTYWLAVTYMTQPVRNNDARVRGCVISTTNVGYAAQLGAPDTTVCDRIIQLGKPLRFFRDDKTNSTSAIKSISTL